MLFTTFDYAVFLSLTLAIYYVLRPWKARLSWLFLASVVFYATWNVWFLGLIFFQTAIDFKIAQWIDRSTNERTRKQLVFWMVFVNLCILGFFKYANFFTGDQFHLQIILPLGISFYTFEGISYGVDVYRRKIRAHTQLLEYWVFITFFPHLVAGPIVRASDFLPQLQSKPRVDLNDFFAGLARISFGAFKKLVIADSFGQFSDYFFGAPNTDSTTAWLGLISYSIQIYFDFSGYSDMAIGSARLFGIRLVENFNWPYLASSIQDFWKRWHISLSSWLRDYLYFSLGGSQRSALRTYLNLLITMTLGGLWHGASWTFVLWGAYHGVLLVLHRAYKNHLPVMPMRFNQATTLIVVMMGWLLFRCQSISDLMLASQSLLGLGTGMSSTAYFLEGGRPFLLLGVLAFHFFQRPLGRQWENLSVAFKGDQYRNAAVCVALTVITYAWRSQNNNNPFIYFQF